MIKLKAFNSEYNDHWYVIDPADAATLASYLFMAGIENQPDKDYTHNYSYREGIRFFTFSNTEGWELTKGWLGNIEEDVGPVLAGRLSKAFSIVVSNKHEAHVRTRKDWLTNTRYPRKTINQT